MIFEVNPGVPARPGQQPLRDGEIDLAQLKQLVEIQTQIVKQAEQNQLAKERHAAVRRTPVGVPRRLLRFLAQLW